MVKLEIVANDNSIALAQAVRIDPTDGKYHPDQSQADVAVAKDGTRYRMTAQRSNIDGKVFETVQFTRETPKLRGKAARKAEKRRRQLNRQVQIEPGGSKPGGQ